MGWRVYRQSALARNYAQFLVFMVVIGVLGVVSMALAATGVVSMDVFAGMPFAGQDLFIVLTVGAFFDVVYFGLLATRNFEDMVVTNDGIAVPVRSFREMLRGNRHFLPFSMIESVRFFERRETAFIEIKLVPEPGRRAALVYSSLWIPDEVAFEARLRDWVTVTLTRPTRGPGLVG